jgi:hypothetical protein
LRMKQRSPENSPQLPLLRLWSSSGHPSFPWCQIACLEVDR